MLLNNYSLTPYLIVSFLVYSWTDCA